MAIDLFGFTIGRNGKPTAKSTNGADSKAASFVGPDEYDGTFTVDGPVAIDVKDMVVFCTSVKRTVG